MNTKTITDSRGHPELTALKEEDQQTKPIETAAWEAESRAVLGATFVGTVTLKWMIYLRPSLLPLLSFSRRSVSKNVTSCQTRCAGGPRISGDAFVIYFRLERRDFKNK